MGRFLCVFGDQLVGVTTGSGTSTGSGLWPFLKKSGFHVQDQPMKLGYGIWNRSIEDGFGTIFYE